LTGGATALQSSWPTGCHDGSTSASAVVLPDGAVRNVSGHSDSDHTLEIALVRIAR